LIGTSLVRFPIALEKRDPHFLQQGGDFVRQGHDFAGYRTLKVSGRITVSVHRKSGQVETNLRKFVQTSEKEVTGLQTGKGSAPSTNVGQQDGIDYLMIEFPFN
jgi:hypothetical protein